MPKTGNAKTGGAWKSDAELRENMLAKGHFIFFVQRLPCEPGKIQWHDNVVQDQLTEGTLEKVPPAQFSDWLH